MIRFTDGPAIGVRLELHRAPVLLRVVEDTTKQGPERWDALDQIEDRPLPAERIHVYVRREAPSVAFVDFQENGRRRGRRLLVAQYRLYAHQPDDADARDNDRWRDWCEAQRGRLVEQGVI